MRKFAVKTRKRTPCGKLPEKRPSSGASTTSATTSPSMWSKRSCRRRRLQLLPVPDRRVLGEAVRVGTGGPALRVQGSRRGHLREVPHASALRRKEGNGESQLPGPD